MPTRNNSRTKRQSRQKSRSGKTRRTRPDRPGTVNLPPIVRFTGYDAPFPTTMRKTFNYTDTVPVISTSGSLGYKQFRLNSLFDPDLTGTGHQPRYFDQLCGGAGPYNKYRVTDVEVTLEVAQLGSDAAQLGFFAAGPTPSSALPTPANYAGSNAEIPGWVSDLLVPNMGVPLIRRWKIPIHSVMGVRRSVVNDSPNYAAVYSASPSVEPVFTVQYQNSNGSSSSCWVKITLEFTAQLELRSSIAAS